MFQLAIHAAEGLGRDCLESLLRAGRRIEVIAVAETLAELKHAARGVSPQAVLVVDPPADDPDGPTATQHATLWPGAEVLRGSYEAFSSSAAAPTPGTPRVIPLSASADAIADAVTGNLDALEHPTPATNTAVLTSRETRVLRHLAEGLSARESADRLALKSRTIDSHRRRISRKLGLASAAQLTRFAIATGLVAAGHDARHNARQTPDRRPASDPDSVAGPVTESAVRAPNRRRALCRLG